MEILLNYYSNHLDFGTLRLLFLPNIHRRPAPFLHPFLSRALRRPSPSVLTGHSSPALQKFDSRLGSIQSPKSPLALTFTVFRTMNIFRANFKHADQLGTETAYGRNYSTQPLRMRARHPTQELLNQGKGEVDLRGLEVGEAWVIWEFSGKLICTACAGGSLLSWSNFSLHVVCLMRQPSGSAALSLVTIEWPGMVRPSHNRVR